MGSRDSGAVFRQSLRDFPLAVALGENRPSFGLHRFKQGLRFVPSDDEGFTLRGDNQRIVYKGRRRSHRFTILGDTSFEYDCILEKPPDTNTVTLFMEGAENFDFFRQPDFLKEPLLAGSYAVYKKETLIGEGTGKLCHIHRPEIIDARGRRCWGDLSVEGNRLCIAIPEKWLGDAKYPVVVDPTIGTSTVGYQTNYYNDDNEYQQLFFEYSIGVNRFLLAETFNGTATAYVYVYEKDYQGRCRPVIYSDNNNVPLTRRSANERDFDIAVSGGKAAGWRSATFSTNTSLAGGSYVWFGVFCDWFAPRFDYGAKCYWDFWDHLGTDIPNTYPVWSANWFYNFKLSVYFTYTSAQNYVRTITQGVKLTDGRKLKVEYKRNFTQTAGVKTVSRRFETMCRKCVMTAHNTMRISRLPVLIRKITESIKATMTKRESRSMSRKCADEVTAVSASKRALRFFRNVRDRLSGIDSQSFSVVIVRSVTDTARATHKISHWGAFVRGLLVRAGSTAETAHIAAYRRNLTDVAQAKGAVSRGLLLLVRIITRLFVRDYLLGRFLQARQELVLKSCICREIILESKLT